MSRSRAAAGAALALLAVTCASTAGPRVLALDGVRVPPVRIGEWIDDDPRALVSIARIMDDARVL